MATLPSFMITSSKPAPLSRPPSARPSFPCRPPSVLSNLFLPTQTLHHRPNHFASSQSSFPLPHRLFHSQFPSPSISPLPRPSQHPNPTWPFPNLIRSSVRLNACRISTCSSSQPLLSRSQSPPRQHSSSTNSRLRNMRRLDYEACAFWVGVRLLQSRWRWDSGEWSM